MAARSGMSELITEWRAKVGNVGTATISDDRAQQILDNARFDFWQEPLRAQPLTIGSGTVVYKVFYAPYQNLEGTASGTVAYRLYDSFGTAKTPDSLDMQRGIFRFNADQAGSARYLDGRSYDLNGAAADGWRELSGLYASYYDFAQEGRKFSRSQWFEHCQSMARSFDGQKTARQIDIARGDFA